MAGETMDLKRPLPKRRTLEQIRNHYAVEKSIATRLKRADREERRRIYATMYDELFARVPDHPRLTRRRSEALTREANQDKLALVADLIDPSKVFVEFAPGDCRFAAEVAGRVRRVYGIDISDQRGASFCAPPNFELIVYDGYELTGVPEASVDVVFSDQLIEHLHPEDTEWHFRLVHRMLKPGGVYVFRTPHWLTGPHDVSRYFSDEPEGFHLKEWTYREMRRLVLGVGFRGFRSYWYGRQTKVRVPCALFGLCEAVLSLVPKKYARGPARYLTPTLVGMAVK